MKKNYIKYIRSKVGHEKIFLNFVCGALFDIKGNILLQRRGDTKRWGLPGGSIELGENFKKALKREFQEEVGVSIMLLDLIGAYTDKIHSVKYPNGDACQPIVILYKVKTNSKIDIRKRNSETLGLSFFAQKQLPIITNRQHKQMINDSFKSYSSNNARKI